MRTTVSIHDELLTAAKRRAGERGITLGQLIDEALQRELHVEHGQTQGPAIPVFRGGGAIQPGVDLNSNRAIAELLDEGLPLEKLR
jgi:hypothetical protein